MPEYSEYTHAQHGTPTATYAYDQGTPLPSSMPTSWERRSPNCAVCDAPAKEYCECEWTSLIIAVEDSEERIMSSVMDEIRSWVSARARSKILSDYRAASTLRQARFNHFLQSSRAHHMSTEQLDEAHYHMEHDMDNDWRRCMQKYPQVLDHYYTIAKEAVRSGRGLESIVHGESSRSRDRSNSRESSAGASGGGGAHYTTRRSGGGRGRHSSSGGGSGWSTPRRVYTD